MYTATQNSTPSGMSNERYSNEYTRNIDTVAIDIQMDEENTEQHDADIHLHPYTKATDSLYLDGELLGDDGVHKGTTPAPAALRLDPIHTDIIKDNDNDNDNNNDDIDNENDYTDTENERDSENRMSVMQLAEVRLHSFNHLYIFV